MNKHEIIERLNDLAERARDAYIHTNDEVAKKDNDAIMEAIELIGHSSGDAECKDEAAPRARTLGEFNRDVLLLRD